MKERKALLDDAQAATQAALAEGIVAGGGVALLRADKVLDKLKLEGDEAAGRARSFVKNVLDYPLRYIAENAGVDGAVVVNRVRHMKGKNDGYNADTDDVLATWLPTALSIRPRSCGPRCRMRPAWRPCC